MQKQKDIQTEKAGEDLVKEFLDYADCADASYAMLHFVEQNEKIEYSLDKLKSENPCTSKEASKGVLE